MRSWTIPRFAMDAAGDAGTSEGARKAAQTRKSGGGAQADNPHSVAAHQEMVAHHNKQRAEPHGNYTLSLQHRQAAKLHTEAASAIKAKHPSSKRLSKKAHSFTKNNHLY
jgi:hypothetical protein